MLARTIGGGDFRMKEDDIRDVMADEKGRGRRRPKDPETKRQERELLRKFNEALSLENESDFLEAIRELGLTDDEQTLRNVLKIWRESWRKL